jgi:hypothetical protein
VTGLVRRSAAAIMLTALFAATIVIFGRSTATADAIHNSSIRNFEFTQILLNPCNDHPIEFSGTFQVVDQFTANANTTSFHTNTSFKGVTGVDLISGEVFHWTQGATAMDGFILDGEEFRNVSTLNARWITAGPGNDVLFIANFVFIIDASGIVRVDVGDFTISCV